MHVNFDPVILALGPLQIRWYGLMYVLGFLVGGKILKILCEEKYLPMPKEKVDSLVTHVIVGMFFGARLAYVFIYNWDYYSDHLSEIFSVWQGGLSFHGALAGILIAGGMFAKKNNLHFFQVADAFAIAGTPGLFFGRMGNFINGELYGRITDAPWGMIFRDGGPMPRHPSQLYEGISEGIILFLLFFILRKKVKYYGILGAMFVIGYGFFRFIVEFFREADSQLGYYMGNMFTMGQILCFIMILCGFIFMMLAFKKKLKVTRA